MKLILGLGNPGTEYSETRHNAGFLFLDMLRESWGFPEFSREKKFQAEIASGMRNKGKVLLAKPETYMNRSGDALLAIMHFYKLSPENILVIHDDLDLPLGSWKVATDSGAAGHNGVSDIIGKLGTKNFRRIRIGIGRPSDDRDPADYVLEKFLGEERASVREVFKEILGTL